MVYYAENLSYTMVGVHDYIIVEPENINTYTHGFRTYKSKIYARVLLDSSLEASTQEVQNSFSRGFSNFYLDYDEENTSLNIHRLMGLLYSKFPDISFIVNARFFETQELAFEEKAVLLEGGFELEKSKLEELKSNRIDIIELVGVATEDIEDSQEIVKSIEQKGRIPYVSNNSYDVYGVSSKVAVKREVFTLIDESKHDRTLLAAHRIGAMPLEYLGYVQKLYDINKGLPDIDAMRHYAGVVIWLSQNYEEPAKLIDWIVALNKIGIKVVFAGGFGFNATSALLKPLKIVFYDGDTSVKNKKRILYKDEMIGFEIEPPLGDETLYMSAKDAKDLLVFEDSNHMRSVPAAITPWGGYAIAEAFVHELEDENVWVINPFEFFAQALRLPKILVPDTTTENGRRLFFTHIDGDGMISFAEFNPELFAGDVILEKILKVYKVPHSVSIIGAEVDPDGLYPEYSQRSLKIAKSMYALSNVEPATHTYSHPFIWGKIVDDSLDERYRLKPKGYKFSLQNEFSRSLENINTKLLKKGDKHKAKTVFWSGDCTPRVNALSYLYEHNILNINGGDTTISNTQPWVSLIAPIGLEREGFYQLYTGAQNENVFTNDWLGPFWGFKRVVQTFKHTNSPRRIKPIDVYYHLYSGSKIASVNALKYVFDWSLAQEIYPIFTSEYIVKAMDFYTASFAHEGNQWLVDGMKNLKTVRLEEEKLLVDVAKSKNVYGVKNFETHTYVALKGEKKHLIVLSKKPQMQKSYLVSSNAKILEHIEGKQRERFVFSGYLDLDLEFYIAPKCHLESSPKMSMKEQQKGITHIHFKNRTKGTIDVVCR